MKNIILVFLIVMLSGCMPDGNPATESIRFMAACGTPAGFFLGIWHGIIAPLSWFFSLLVSNVNVYEVCNNGGWYDFGFVLGAGIIFSSAKSKSK